MSALILSIVFFAIDVFMFFFYRREILRKGHSDIISFNLYGYWGFITGVGFTSLLANLIRYFAAIGGT